MFLNKNEILHHVLEAWRREISDEVRLSRGSIKVGRRQRRPASRSQRELRIS